MGPINSEREGQKRSQRGRYDYGKNGKRDVMLLTLKMEEGGHETRNVGGHQKLEKAKILL